MGTGPNRHRSSRWRHGAFLGLGAALASALALGCGAATAGPDGGEALAPREGAAVYKVVVREAGSLAPGRVEWVDPDSGAYRIEAAGVTKIFSGDRWASIRSDAVDVRVGSPAFLGHLADAAVSRDALAGYAEGRAAEGGVELARSEDGDVELRFAQEGSELVAEVEETLSLEEADERGLFDVPAEQATSLGVERRPGVRPTLPVRAYWFEGSVDLRRPVTAVEHSVTVTPQLAAAGWSPRDEMRAYIVFYELPSALGATSAYPDQEPPDGELQVVSQPRTLPSAQGAIAAFDGVNGELEGVAWPRTEVVLAGGERAVVVPDRSEGAGPVRAGFSVITPTTLVSVVGDVREEDIPRLAAQLVVVGR